MRRLIVGRHLLVSLTIVVSSVLGTSVLVASPIVVDGGFENPVTSGRNGSWNGNVDWYFQGQIFGAWTVEFGSIDLQNRNICQPGEGNQSIDMSGLMRGAIYQDVNVVANQEYQLSFMLSGNPDAGPNPHQMEVWWGSALLDTVSFDTTGLSDSNMGWKPKTYEVFSTQSITRLRFVSLDEGVAGCALDAVSVTPVPEPSTLTLIVIAAASLIGFSWRRRRARRFASAVAVLLVLTAGVANADVFNMTEGQTSLKFVTVDDPGNAADTTGYGSVPYTYQMGKYDVTVGQYCEFLNAVAKTDDYGLYNAGMANPSYHSPDGWYSGCGITQSSSSGIFTYSVRPGSANFPANWVSWGSAARFCNWLQNGQPTSGVENGSTTENGAYTLNGATTDTALMAISRNAGAAYCIPSENEWYKAAYYKGGGTNAGYWTYTTKSNSLPGNTLPDTGNNANYYNGSYTDPTYYLTPVGEFSASPGPYGTFDMGGNVWQWNESNLAVSGHGLRGGSFCNGPYYLPASNSPYDYSTVGLSGVIGFRVASVPEPGSIVLLLAGGLCLLAYAWRQQRAA